jgi:hypothetical protein
LLYDLTDHAPAAFNNFMTKRNWLFISVALVLAGAYTFYFTGWFAPKIIHITSHNARVTRARRAGRTDRSNADDDSTAVPILFKLGRPYKLTELKVVALDEWQTNKNCLPLWHLIAGPDSVPIDRPFAYGQNIRGMKPEVTGMRAEPLQSGVIYRLLVTDGSAKGELDFTPVAKPAVASP